MTNRKLVLNEKKLKVLKVKDRTDKMTISVNRLFDLPMRLLLFGKSGHGKSNLLVGLLLNKNYGYDKIFDGDRIFLFAPSPYADEKLKIIIEEKSVPDSNVFDEYSDELLLEVYDMLVEDFKDRAEEGEPLKMSLIVLDDLSFSGKLAGRFNALAKVYCNSRKYLISVICLSQAYTQIAKNIRSQASGMIIFNTSNRELKSIEEENNYLKGGKSAFFEMFRNNVLTKFDFLCINYSNDYKELYLNSEFKNILELESNKTEDK